MSKRKISILSIVLFVIAGLLAIYTIWSFVNVLEYLKNIMQQQQITFKGNEYDIINTFVSSCGQYAFYAIVLAVLGWILQKMSPVVEPAPEFDEQDVFAEDEAIARDVSEEITVEEAVDQFDTSSETAE